MSQTAVQRVDHAIPLVPVRQWVLSLPIPLRLLQAAALTYRIAFGAADRNFKRPPKARQGQQAPWAESTRTAA